jgi:hypothetical protein
MGYIFDKSGKRVKTIGPRELEKYIGDFVGRGENYWLEGKIWEPLFEWTRLELLVDGDYCFTGEGLGNMKLRLKTGDMISLWDKGDCIFINDSD